MSHSLKVGVSRANITPPVGSVCRGRVSRGVGNELYAKALLFDDGHDRAAIVTVDVIVLAKETVEAARRRVEKLTGMKAGNVMFGASHTHSGPPTTGWLSRGKGYIETYVSELADKMAGAVYEADLNKREALIGAERGEAKISVNRWIMTPEGAKWAPNPDGPADNEVTVLRVDDLDRKLFALLVNYAAHASVRSFGKGGLFSGDYPSYVQSVVEKFYDGEVTALFANGASGDTKIAFVTDDGKRFRYGDLEDAKRYGTIIAAEAVKTAETIKTRAVTRLQASSTVASLPLAPHPTIESVEEELAKRRVAVEEAKKGVKRRWEGLQHPAHEGYMRWAEKTLKQLKEGTAPTAIPAEFQTFKLGEEIILVSVPGELFVEVGLRLKNLIKKRTAFIIGYANGYVGYLPSARTRREDGDRPRYEWYKYVNYGYPSIFSEEMEDVLVKTVESLL